MELVKTSGKEILTYTIDDVYDAICKINLGEVYESSNKFLNYLRHYDKEALECAVFAKENEGIRYRMESPWYYPTMESGMMSLEEAVDRASAQKDKRLRTEYLVQKMRALFSLKKWSECVELWETEFCQMPTDNVMREIVEPYVWGASYRLNPNKDAEVFLLVQMILNPYVFVLK